MITLALRATCVAVAGSLCALTLRRYVPELALVVAIVTGGAVLVLALESLSRIGESLTALAQIAGLEGELTQPVYRVTAIAILTRLAAQLCRDAGEGTVALCCELTGVFAALWATLPLLLRVVELIAGVLL